MEDPAFTCQWILAYDILQGGAGGLILYLCLCACSGAGSRNNKTWEVSDEDGVSELWRA